MANLPIDGMKITLVATGKVRPVAVYAEDAAGNNRRVPGAQEKSDFGIPLWAVDVLLDDDEATRVEAISVKVPSTDEPVVAKFMPVIFEGLTCKPWVNSRAGNQIALSMRAESISAGIPAAATTSGSASKAKAAAATSDRDL